ncbi:PREDICTED: uncharacterized protein LOC106805558 [Priapulus caudatus]|uniref:Uncharacterized protein LOC106805558 n=1 Tax=Priapulus caudatus TaxID=37621 RepID=A0ABM1DRW9_PRICU|nr:PREDICTED: uncharacterized protein LOC106805558 [Priapulus caudatus]XP_014662690.1 PREDICTED: uncharacterized protein LOC106805558 [Priapulus caudatus]
MQNITITRTAREMLKSLHRLTAAEGWNYGLDNLRAIYDFDPLGSFCAIDDNSDMVGHLIGAHVKPDLVMGGLFIVREDMRGKGIGKALFEERSKYVGDANFGISIGSTRLVKHKELYTARHYAFEIIGYGGKRGPLIKAPEKYKIVPISRVDFGELARYDTKICHGMERSRFLNRWAAGLQSRSLVALDGNTIVGYATLRPADRGYRIAPLYGDTPDAIAALFHAITAKHTEEDDHVFMNVPTTNDGMMQIVSDLGLTSAYSLKRMFTKEILMPPLQKIGSLMTMEVTTC